MKKTGILIILAMSLLGCQRTPSNLVLPSLIGDNMIIQQKTDARIWGKADTGHKIRVVASWNEETTTKSGKDGRWSVTIPAPSAGGPYTMTISCRDTSIIIYNIVAGEVWFCSGQSNMEMPMAGWPPVDTVMHSSRTIESTILPEIRLFIVQRKISGEPLEDCTGRWEMCGPSTIKQFSATAFFFGKKLYDELRVPVGLIESVWGGTPAESWISSTALENAGEFVEQINAIKESAPLQHGYQEWLEDHEQLEIQPSGNDQWKNLTFNDESVPSPEYDDSSWPAMNLSGQFERATGELDGAVWFRKKVELPADYKGKDLVLSLGPIDDMDRTYFNGTPVGATEESGYWQAARNYDIPGNLAGEGVNIISVRVLDNQGGGGIWGIPGSMKISVKGGKQAPVSIEGEWKYQPAAELIGNRFYIFDLSKNEFFAQKRPISLSPYTPSVLYNAMVNPVVKYPIKGAIWYQGEANVGRADQYAKIFPLMIQNWRDSWGIKDFPFYYVQIAPYVYSNVDSTESALLREAQEKALELPGTGMAVTLDIATVMNIHPPYKKEVGERLAAFAFNNDYEIPTPCTGPVYKSMSVEGSTIKIRFDNSGDGLVSRNGRLKEFEIAGEDGKYVMASAGIVNNNEVVVYSPLVNEPVSVRYCWRNGAEASVFNSAGLPAWQFRTKK
ncbi:MAG TPA: sialate O-acetylesterase [Bacteroidales bacterium]|nr:sialate O-acetylesterase [Bacteroidales bacterium]